MAGTRAWVAWVVGMTILYRSSQMMLTEYPPAPASSTVPLPVLSTPTHLGRGWVQGPEESARKRRRRCSGRRSHRRGFAALAKYGPRLAAAGSDAHLGQAPSSSTATPCWRRISRRWMLTCNHGFNRCSVIHSSPSASSDALQLDVVVRQHSEALGPPLAPAPAPRMRRARLSDHAQHSRVRPQRGCGRWLGASILCNALLRAHLCAPRVWV